MSGKARNKRTMTPLESDSMREVFNLFSFDSVVQVKQFCYLTDYQFRRPTTSSGLKLYCYK